MGSSYFFLDFGLDFLGLLPPMDEYAIALILAI
jgi:hypothetical protein